MAATPPIEVKVTADTKQAEAGLQRVENALDDVGNKAALSGKKMAPVGKSLSTIGTTAGVSTHSMRNLAQQLSQVGQQASVTGNFMGALAIQLPDILGGFGGLPAVIAGAAIGLGTALIPSLMDTTDAADRFKEALEAVDDTISQLREPMSVLTMSVDELRQKYGEAADQVLRYAQFQAESRAAFAAAALKEQIDLLDGTIYKYMAVENEGQRYKNVLKRIEKDLKLTGDATVQFEDALTDLHAALTFEEQQAALNKVLDLIEKNKVSAGDIPPELRRALDEMVSLATATEEARRIMALLGAESRNVSVGTGWVFDPATDMPPPRGIRGSRGGGRSDPLKRNLERIRESLASETELLTSRYEKQQEMLEQAFEKRMLTQEDFQNLSLRSAQEYQDALMEIERARQAERLGAISGAFGDIASLMSTENKKLFNIGKAAAIAEATINGYSAAVAAWDKGMKVGGPPVAAAFTAASLARTGAMISGIASQQIGGGGGTPSTAGGATVTASPETRTVSEIRFLGNLGADGQTIVDIINSEYDRGNFVRAVVG